MANGFWTAALVLGLSASACGMTAAPRAAPLCQFVGPAKLPAESGGAPSICGALSRAIAARGIKTRFTVALRVSGKSMLSADVTLADGRTLPTLHMAHMDGPVTKPVLERFGVAIADHVAGAPH